MINIKNEKVTTNKNILTMLKAKEIVNRVRSEISDEYNLNYDFVDYCDLCSERVEKILQILGYDCVIINGYYTHTFESADEDNYGHHWVQTEDFILDPSVSQFDSNEYVKLKTLSPEYKEAL